MNSPSSSLTISQSRDTYPPFKHQNMGMALLCVAKSVCRTLDFNKRVTVIQVFSFIHITNARCVTFVGVYLCYKGSCAFLQQICCKILTFTTQKCYCVYLLSMCHRMFNSHQHWCCCVAGVTVTQIHWSVYIVSMSCARDVRHSLIQVFLRYGCYCTY